MYTAIRIDNSFHIAFNGHGRMRAKSKIGIIRLIMTNICAMRDMLSKGFVTVTTDCGGRYVEMKFAWDNGSIVLINTFSAKDNA